MHRAAARWVLLLVLIATAKATAADWPMYRCDSFRSGYTSEKLPAKLSLAWTYRPTHPPSPSWPRDDRMLFDRANEVAVAGGLLFFGSSADCQIVALDAATGRTRWTFVTDAPVRFAPAVWKDRVYAVSDDGYLYCLSAANGTLIQRWRGGPSDEMILGNGRMVSRWPARGGPAIRDGIVYFAAGVWQSDGVFLIAIDAASGEVLWRNDESGKITMPQPHGGAVAESGVSAQGYLVATDHTLLVPTGRAVPAAFWRRDGKFLYYHLQANGHIGGSQTVVGNLTFFNGGSAFHLPTGTLQTKLGPGNVAAIPGAVAHAGKKDLRMLTYVEKTLPDRKGLPIKTRDLAVQWTLAGVDGSAAVIAAGDKILCAGGTTVTAVDTAAHQVSWTTQVDGTPYGLAVADERLYVSTDRGTIYAFDGEANASAMLERQPRNSLPVERSFELAAEEIVRRTGVKDGYCLDLDCGDGSLAIALAKRTNLQIYALSTSQETVAAARRRLIAAGLYGVRITVHQSDVASRRYGRYFADLIVSSQSLVDGPLEISPTKPPPELRPFGGQACTGKAKAMQVVARGPLENAGSWTHQYSDLGNTGCSTDELVQGKLHALWFRDVSLEMPQRHGRGPAPLYHEGRMFVEGLSALRAVDAYNGRDLWEFALPGVLQPFNADHLSGTAVTGSNFCVADGSVYIHDRDRCYRIDAVTGRKLGEFKPPDDAESEPGQWGFIACDGQRLYGSIANPHHQVRFAYVRADMSELWGESSGLFALDAKTGDFLWRYDAQESIRNNAIAVGGGRVYLIDRLVADEDKWDPKDAARKLPAVAKVNQPQGWLVSLDAKTGKTRWKSDRNAFGTTLVYSANHDALLMCYQSTRFKLPSEVGGRLAVYRGTTGDQLWNKRVDYVTRPLINDRIIYAQGGAWDLVTGENQPFDFKRSYGCGQFAGSRHMLVFRSATLGYFDLSRGSGTENFGGIRPGCWINALPVGGLVLVPDASAGCQCSYQNRSWMALAPEN